MSRASFEIGHDSASGPSNPFSTPPRSTSSPKFSHARERSNVPGPRYYHSRRIIKDENAKPPKIKKDPGEKWLWIIPTMGLFLGLAISGLMIYMSNGGTSYRYCSVLNEDFSSGSLDPKVWTIEVEASGFGYGLRNNWKF